MNMLFFERERSVIRSYVAYTRGVIILTFYSIFVDEEIWKVEINKQSISGVESQARRNPVPFPIISR